MSKNTFPEPQPDSASYVPTFEPSYVPTSVPTYVPTSVPTSIPTH